MNEVGKIESAADTGAYEFESDIHISTTPGAGQFNWKATPQGPNLEVEVSYGGGDRTNNRQSVSIPTGQSGEYALPKAKNTEIYVEGKVKAVFWGTTGGASGYVISLTGGRYQFNGRFTADITETIVAAYVG